LKLKEQLKLLVFIGLLALNGCAGVILRQVASHTMPLGQKAQAQQNMESKREKL